VFVAGGLHVLGDLLKRRSRQGAQRTADTSRDAMHNISKVRARATDIFALARAESSGDDGLTLGERRPTGTGTKQCRLLETKELAGEAERRQKEMKMSAHGTVRSGNLKNPVRSEWLVEQVKRVDICGGYENAIYDIYRSRTRIIARWRPDHILWILIPFPIASNIAWRQLAAQSNQLTNPLGWRPRPAGATEPCQLNQWSSIEIRRDPAAGLEQWQCIAIKWLSLTATRRPIQKSDPNSG
jgi:hypothetical protein